MHALKLALRTLLREWRSGELGVLLLALTTAVAALTGVGFLVGRIDTAVREQATQVLAADIRVSSTQPLPSDWFTSAAQQGVRSASIQTLLSVVFRGDDSQLANVEAVSPGYPLRGTLLVADQPFATGTATRSIPGPGEVWPSSKLLATLGGGVGSQLAIGAATLKVTRVLISRPDQGANLSDLAPALIMNLADLPATQLIQPEAASATRRSSAADPGSIRAFRPWLTAHRRAGDRLRDVSDASPQLESAVDRAGRFLTLASLVSVLLCSIAVAMSARQYVRRHLDSVALLKTLGASRGFTLIVSLLQLLIVALLASVAGSVVGYVAQEWLLRAVRDLLGTATLPPANLAPLVMGVSAALAVSGGLRTAAAAAAGPGSPAAGPATRRGATTTTGHPGLRAGPPGHRGTGLVGCARRAPGVAVPARPRCIPGGAGRGWVCARYAVRSAARSRGRGVAIRHCQPQSPPRRQHGADRCVRRRPDGAAGPGRGPR